MKYFLKIIPTYTFSILDEDEVFNFEKFINDYFIWETEF